MAVNSSTFKWLILIGLLCAQIAYAGHQLSHDANDLGEQCQICTSYENFENGLSDAVCTGTMPVGTHALPTYINAREFADYQNAYGARAPPKSPDSSS
jgi:hypothetical protein